MWNPIDSVLFVAGLIVAAILVVALLGSGPGGWLILGGLIALIVLMPVDRKAVERRVRQRQEDDRLNDRP